MKFKISRLVVLLFAALALPSFVAALPFNDDMVNVQKRTGSVMRPKPADSIALGSLDYVVNTREEAQKLSNPLKGDKESAQRGRVLFSMNCYPCHGNIETQPSGSGYTGGPVSQKMLVRAPDLRAPVYRDNRTDGDIYGAIHFGSPSGLMQPLGWKFSPREHWDLVNFVRSVQQKQGK